MILDNALKLYDLATDPQAFSPATDSADGTDDVLDTGAPGSPLTDNDFTVGEHRLALIVEVTTALTGVGAVTIELISDSTEDLATAPIVHASLVTTFAALAVDTVHKIGIPSANYPSKRYVGVRLTGATSITAGNFNAWLVRDVQQGLGGVVS